MRADPVCYGTLLSWSQYLGDVLGGTFRDARIRPYGTMSAEEVARWTSADKSASVSLEPSRQISDFDRPH